MGICFFYFFFFEPFPGILGASQVALMVKNLPANAGDTREGSSIPRSGK